MGIFAAIAGAVIPKLAGAVFGRRDEERAEDQAEASDHLARRRYLKDRQSERRYASAVTQRDRAYAEKLTKRDQAYAERMLFQDRKYAAGITASDRAYNERMHGVDLAQAAKSRRETQGQLDRAAERTAASRGIDFKRIRDDAMAAGFNPLTALQFAQSYSTERLYGVAGDGSAGVQRAPVSSTAAGGAPAVSSHYAPGASAAVSGFQSPGSGYLASGGPALSSSAFLSEALSAGVETGFNYIDARDDAMYRNIEGQVARGQLAREYARQTPRQFGYSLAKVAPYSPSVSVYRPPLGDRPERLQLPHGSIQTGTSATADRVEQEYGDIPSGAYGAWRLYDDFMRDRGWLQGAWDPRPRDGKGRPFERPRPRRRGYVPAGTGSYAITGSQPRAPRLGAGGGGWNGPIPDLRWY